MQNAWNIYTKGRRVAFHSNDATKQKPFAAVFFFLVA